MFGPCAAVEACSGVIEKSGGTYIIAEIIPVEVSLAEFEEPAEFILQRETIKFIEIAFGRSDSLLLELGEDFGVSRHGLDGV
jgi:hypothetical protein